MGVASNLVLPACSWQPSAVQSWTAAAGHTCVQSPFITASLPLVGLLPAHRVTCIAAKHTRQQQPQWQRSCSSRCRVSARWQHQRQALQGRWPAGQAEAQHQAGHIPIRDLQGRAGQGRRPVSSRKQHQWELHRPQCTRTGQLAARVCTRRPCAAASARGRACACVCAC